MRALVVTDVHQHGDLVNRLIEQEQADMILSCGDQEGYYNPPVPCWFVNGNHEDFGLVGTLKQRPDADINPNLRIITPDNLVDITLKESFLCVGGLGGIYDPTKFHMHTDQRYFTRREVDQLRRHKGERIDVLLFHETLQLFGIKRREKVVGCQYLDQAVAELKPKLVFCGHHDELITRSLKRGVTAIQLSGPHKSYALLEIGGYGIDSYQVKTNPSKVITAAVLV